MRLILPCKRGGDDMNIFIYIFVMAITTYLVRALPLILLKKPIQSRFLKSFLHYVPAASLTVMTFPAILYATDNILSGAMGLVVAALFSLRNKSLVLVAAASCAAVFITELLMHI